MKALILSSDGTNVTAQLSRPVVGAALLERQVEWLHTAGVTEVVVNRVANGRLPTQLHTEPMKRTGVTVSWIPTAEPLSAVQLGKRAGIDKGEVLFVLEHAVLGDLDLKEIYDRALRGGDDLSVVNGQARVHVVHLDEQRQVIEESVGERHWLLELSSEKAVQELSEKLLSGEMSGVEIRGSQMSPGVWRAHGAVVVDSAKLVPPCYLGAECLVSEKAVVGPGAIIGEGAVIEAGAKIHHARVEDGVVVGQKVLVEHACARAGLIERHEGRRVPVEDELLLGEAHSDLGVFGRLVAAGALVPVAPLAAVTSGKPREWFRRLSRVVQGSGQWMGVRTERDQDRVVVDVLPLLVPPDAQREEEVAATALYEAKKNPVMDLKLLAGLLLRAPSSRRSDS